MDAHLNLLSYAMGPDGIGFRDRTDPVRTFRVSYSSIISDTVKTLKVTYTSPYRGSDSKSSRKSHPTDRYLREVGQVAKMFRTHFTLPLHYFLHSTT